MYICIDDSARYLPNNENNIAFISSLSLSLNSIKKPKVKNISETSLGEKVQYEHNILYVYSIHDN